MKPEPSAGNHDAGRENMEPVPSAGKHIPSVAGAGKFCERASKSPFTMHREIRRPRFHSKNASNVFRPHYARGLEMQQLCLRRTRSGKSRDYGDVIVFGKLRFHNVFGPRENEKQAFSNSFSLKSVFEKVCFHDGLV